MSIGLILSAMPYDYPSGGLGNDSCVFTIEGGGESVMNDVKKYLILRSTTLVHEDLKHDSKEFIFFFWQGEAKVLNYKF